MLCAKAAFAAERAEWVVEMVPACAACKAFVSKLNGAAWESGFGDHVWLASVLSGTKIKHLSEVIQLCQPDVCQVTQFAGTAHPPGCVTARPEQYRVLGRWHFCQK